jgi:methylmalonyl-CoA mutase
MTDDALPLAAEFPAATQAEWRRLVETALKGADFDKRLMSRTYDGLAIAPLYPRAKNAAPAGRAAAPWQVVTRIDHPDPAAANTQALHDLENGVTGLTLVFAGSLNANGYGLDASPQTIARVLDGIQLDAGITIDLDISRPTRTAARVFAAHVKERGVDPAAIDLRAGINPVGGFAATGTSQMSWSELSKIFAGMVGGLAAEGFRGPFAVADGRIVHSAGGSEAQELAFSLAVAVDCLRALEAAGVPLETARAMIYFRLAADDDQFLTLAKFRAIRKLWARVEEACGLAAKPATVAAETAWRMMTRRDPYVNMLRATVAVTAAGLGGADSISVLPYTAAIGLPDAFARRIALNMQLVLLEESNLARVSDPAAGACAIEALTQQLCATAWSQFQRIEAAGGTWAALLSGHIQREVAAVRAKREKAVARRKDAITGVSDFPFLAEKPVQVLGVAAVKMPQEQAAALTIEPLPRIRLAQSFEDLRDKSDAMLVEKGARPKVFLASLGKPSDSTARVTFARNFYEAGGIEALVNDSFASIDAMVAAFKASGATIACLCSSDAIYAAEAAGAAAALTKAGAIVHLAGRGGEHEAQWRAAGVKTFIYAGSDVLATLRAVHDILGKPGS